MTDSAFADFMKEFLAGMEGGNGAGSVSGGDAAAGAGGAGNPGGSN